MTVNNKITIINKMLKISSKFKDHINETYGLFNIAGSTGGDIDIYFTEAITHANSDINEMGIYFSDESDMFYDSSKIDSMIILRDLFSIERLSNLFNSIIIRNRVESFIDNYTGDRDIIITNLLEVMKSLLPLSIDWGTLYLNRFSIINNESFVEHIVYLIQNKEDYSSDDEISTISKFAVLLNNHKENVINFRKNIDSNPNIDYKFNGDDLPNYDNDLVKIDPSILKLYIESKYKYFLHKEETDIDVVSLHKQVNDHHLEYYIYNNITNINNVTIVKIVSEYCIDNISANYIESEIYPLLELTNFNKEVKEMFINLLLNSVVKY